MRRILASLLVSFFGFSLIAPAVFAADPDANLPACCRRDGKHHCAMMMRIEHHPGPGIEAAPCAMFPGSVTMPANHVPCTPTLARVVFTGFIIHPAVASRVEARSRISYSQAGHKRGPPALFS